MDGPAIICQRLKEIREKKGLKSKDVAAALAMNESTYSHYERGIRFPKIDTFYEICQFLDVSPDYLFGLTDTPRPFARQQSSKEKENIWENIIQTLENVGDDLYKIAP